MSSPGNVERGHVLLFANRRSLEIGCSSLVLTLHDKASTFWMGLRYMTWTQADSF